MKQHRESTVLLQPAMGFAEIGAALGITKQGAHALYQSGMRKLRAHGLAPARAMLSELASRQSYAGTSRGRRIATEGWGE